MLECGKLQSIHDIMGTSNTQSNSTWPLWKVELWDDLISLYSFYIHHVRYILYSKAEWEFRFFYMNYKVGS